MATPTGNARQFGTAWINRGGSKFSQEGKMTVGKTTVQHDPTKTMSVVDAGRMYFGLGRNASYDAAHRGDIPTIMIGGKIVAVIPAIEQMLDRAGVKKSAPE